MVFKSSTTGVAAATLLSFLLPERDGVNRLHLPSFFGVCEVRSSIRGRMRLYMPIIRSDGKLAKSAVEQLYSTGVFSRIELNERLATVLLVFDADQVEPATVLGVCIRLFGLSSSIEGYRPGKISRSLHEAKHVVNQAILERSKGFVDAKVLLGGGLTLLAARSMVQNGIGTPGALTLLWWVIRLFSGDEHV